MPDELSSLFGKIAGGTARIGILGMGYVGLPLAMTFSKKIHRHRYDPEMTKVASLLKGKSYIDDINDSEIRMSSARPDTDKRGRRSQGM